MSEELRGGGEAKAAGPHLVPVDHDPFAATAPVRNGAPNFVPVDHDPFASDKPTSRYTPDQLAVARAQVEADGSAAGAVALGLARSVPFADRLGSALDYATGMGQGKGATSYAETLARNRAMIDAYDEKHRAAGIVGQVAGALALPGGGLTAQGVKGAAKLGAAYGAAYGAGEADDLTNVGDVAGRAAIGSAAGGALGGVTVAALPYVGRAIGAVGDAVSDKLAPFAATMRGARDPGAEAARRVQGAFSKDAAAGAGMTEAEMAAAQHAGAPLIAADAGGETVRALARSAANQSPIARDALTAATTDRYAAQAPRISQFILDAGKAGGDIEATRAALQQQAKAANRPAYSRAYAEGSQGVWNDELAQLMQAPEVQSAIRASEKTGANKAAADGFKPPENPFDLDAAGNIVLRKGKDGATALPTLQFWDSVKQNIDDAVGRYMRSGDKGAAADALNLKSQLVQQLDAAVPSYAKARQGASAFFGQENALDAGKAFLSSSADLNQASRAISGMSGPEKKLFQDGFASALADKINSARDGRDVVNAFFGSPAQRQRLQIAFGQAKAGEVEAMLRTEALMTATKRAIDSNSTTARQLAEMSLAGIGAGANAAWSGDMSAGTLSTGAVVGGLLGAAARRKAAGVNASVAEQVGKMLASSDPAVARRAIQSVASSPKMMKLLDDAHGLVPKIDGAIGGSYAPPELAGPRLSNAQHNQEVDRRRAP